LPELVIPALARSDVGHASDIAAGPLDLFHDPEFEATPIQDADRCVLDGTGAANLRLTQVAAIPFHRKH
jgi:hypothetical protein